MLGTMLKIIAADAAPPPTRAWAEDAWRQNPNLHPSWWRENLGFTHSKLIVDARHGVALPLPAGVNCVLTAGQTGAWAEGVLRVAVCSALHTPLHADVVVWQPAYPCTTAQAVAALVWLEEQVRQGVLAAYGVAEPLLGTPQQMFALHEWLAFAAEAAAQVWGRPKRPMLRVLLVPFDVFNTAPLFYPSSLYKEARVALLEHAAALSLWVIADPTPLGIPSPAALQALEAVAHAEATLHDALQGQWPHVQGQPVFAVLPALQQGVAPWQHTTAVDAWQRQVWPIMRDTFSSLGTPQAKALLQAWHEAMPFLHALADAAASTQISHILAQQKQHLAAEFQQQGLVHQQLAVCAAVAGVGGVVFDAVHDLTPLQKMPDIADIGPFFTA
jgi:hypothetical protein